MLECYFVQMERAGEQSVDQQDPEPNRPLERGELCDPGCVRNTIFNPPSLL